ncbi:MAG: imidazoleglycerol-phosphate dehydratase HisB [Dehalococcoidia bacterium]|nr:imidazoleglycerol-phosphate dehydratase HisB [Dehalococcoidia bacterium]
MANRRATIKRETGETKVLVTIDLDGTGTYDVQTGNGFLDHMLSQLSRHSLIDLSIKSERDASGWHHVAEDTGIVLGRAFHEAVGDGKGIRRMGHAIVPLDEALATVAVDISGRGFAEVNFAWTGDKAEDLPVEVLPHLLEAFANEAHVALHITVTGKNNHHLAEAAFKALAKALRMATEVDPRGGTGVPSTKGTISG